MQTRRRTWGELTPQEQALYDWVDLEPDETMERWWELANDLIEEDGSYEAEGWM